MDLIDRLINNDYFSFFAYVVLGVSTFFVTNVISPTSYAFNTEASRWISVIVTPIVMYLLQRRSDIQMQQDAAQAGTAASTGIDYLINNNFFPFVAYVVLGITTFFVTNVISPTSYALDTETSRWISVIFTPIVMYLLQRRSDIQARQTQPGQTQTGSGGTNTRLLPDPERLATLNDGVF